MNSIHEPSSRIMSKNRLRNSTESNRVENRPSALSAQPIASPRAQRPGLTPAAQPALPHALRARPRLLPRARSCCRAPAPAAARLSRVRLLAAPAPQCPVNLPVSRPCRLLSRAPTPRAWARASIRLPPARPALACTPSLRHTP